MIPKLSHQNAAAPRYIAFLNSLSQSAFAGDICADYANRTALSTDNSVYQVYPQGVVYPSNIDDLVCLAELCEQHGYHDIVLTARGGGTGTNGQSLTDGIVVDLSKHMNNILEINVDERWVRVQTGVVKDQLNAALKPHGLFFAPELSTSNRATIGGMINTDASGQGSCLYGKTRDHVLALQTVLLDGNILHSSSLSEPAFESEAEQQTRSGLIYRLVNNIANEHKQLISDTFPPLNRCLTGYDLAHIRDEKQQINLNNILCGSEGTLGFIAEAKLNLLPIPKTSALIIVKYGDFEASLRDASTLMASGPTSIETIDSTVLNLAMQDITWHQVEDFFNDDTPVALQGINLVEFSADCPEALKAQMAPLLRELEQQSVSSRIGYACAMGTTAVNKIWAMRKRAVGLLGNAKGEARPIPFVEDTAVPPENLADFIMAFRAILDAHNLKYGMFGHVDAGVLHVRPALDMKDPKQEALAWEISDQVAALTQKYKGLLWGEHGKGVRSEYAPAFFGELYPQLQRVKAAFDPHNQLNPGKIATPDNGTQLLKISEVATRGAADREIDKNSWQAFDSAVYCNGNGACHNWNPDDAMCPSWKGTRLRTHSPKGRASLVREWLRLLAKHNSSASDALKPQGWLNGIIQWPKKLTNSLGARSGEYDYSHEVYDSMAACLACKSCTGQCPIKVDVPEFRSKFLALYHTRYLRPMKDYLVGSLEIVLPIAAKVPALYNGVMNMGPVKALLKNLVGFVDGPSLSRVSLKNAGVEIANPQTLASLSGEDKQQYVIIVQDAFTRYFETQLLIDTVNALKALGFKPLLAPYRANGKPLHVHGFLSAFKATARKNTNMLRQFSALDIPLVGLDPSMTLTYRAEYTKHLNSEECVEVLLLQEWLSQHLEQLRQHTSNHAQNFTLMPHCTEKTNAAGSIKQWQDIFSALGHTLTSVNVGCCGMAGTFGHEARNLESSKTIYDLSWREPVTELNSKTTLLATGYSCRCQVKREQDIRINHPLQALLKVLGKSTD